MKVTFNPQIRTNTNYTQLNFKSVNTPIVKRAMNPVRNKTGLAALGLGVLYLFKRLFKKQEFTTGEPYLDRSIENWTRPDSLGNIDMHYCNAGSAYVVHKTLKDYPEILEQIHLAKNNEGKNPIYHADLEKMQEIHRAFEDRIDILEKIHLSKNKKGKIKAHNSTTEELREIHRVFKDYPRILTKIHFTKAKNGKYPINYADEEGQKEILGLFSLNPEIAEILRNNLDRK